MKINYPTLKHKQYIEYIQAVCKDQKLSLVLEGSLASGKAGCFSDIDLILTGNLNVEQLEKILTDYGPLAMTNYTEKPEGILILNYADGISVDLDIRKAVLKEELEANQILCDFGFVVGESAERVRLTTDLILARPLWYKTLRLIHRCCLKYLTGKAEAAEGLAKEVAEGIEQCCCIKLQKQEIPERMVEAFEAIDEQFDAGSVVRKLFTPLFKAMKEKM
ncbi:nucleotidyltransferase domain-containing protein [Eubacterium sp. 1001713B170207_170306_E7]|uniref:nucleotidyltransferase domain-containing protein n=1 Tax=Eubacterium sp. 1001713B170207_170306_E7 TaxID=2787097 RepID=UPI00189A191A|nr:nucleotidyltransferase domain-containing protein [Eubacterium sp. 1001713B170207_170306_E7]